MKDNLLPAISDITELLEKENINKQSSDKLHELLENLNSYYMGLDDSTPLKNSITGDRDYFINYLKPACERAVNIDMISAFIMESGVRLIIDDLKKAADRGVKIRILTGSYLNITQPSALYFLKDKLGDSVDLRFYENKSKSFHPKAYIFEYDFDSDLFIGSSNISLSALTGGIEWNYRINSNKSPEDFEHFKSIFEELFNNHSIILDDYELKKYSSTWKRPRVFDHIEKTEKNIEADISTQPEIIDEIYRDNVKPLIRPRGAQIEALYELKKSRAEGYDRGIVVAATGIGKTYLAAFDSIDYKRILFVAHREEILNQAEKSFKDVRQTAKTGFFTGEKKDEEYEILFATVQTLGQTKYLCAEYFSNDEFDYIVIDEFHHAAAGNYINILNYFKPDFLLGLTATPERLDNKDVFTLCDNNVVYEARLKEAINKGWLVPFRYYGVYDYVEYDDIEYKNGKYTEAELEKALMINKRAELILNHYKKYGSKRALGFCTSRSHASYMAKHFTENGVNACAVVSGAQVENGMDRVDAISMLNSGEINVVFSVDMFNEGLDVPSIDMVMFLRPTQSPTVFLQQLGRGLRKSIGKKYLNVLDFIGNYKRAIFIPFFLCGKLSNREGRDGIRHLPSEDEYPEDCFVDFDFRIIDIFKKQAEDGTRIFDLIIEDYFRVKGYLEARPLRCDMFTYMDDELLDITVNKSELNIFSNYLGFLRDIGELTEDEKKLLDTEAYKFLNNMENTLMSRSYKVPLLLAFYNNGDIKLKISEDDIYESFKSFYSKDTNAIDLLKDKGSQDYKLWSEKRYLSVAKNPIDAFLNTAGQFFYKEGKYFCLNKSLLDYKDDRWFIENFKDIINFKIRKYYKTRLREKFKDNMLHVRFALRDEKINIFAMTYGEIPGGYSHQIILCKKAPIPEKRKLFLLDSKKSQTIYELSESGKAYMNSISSKDYNLEYAAFVDCQLKISITKEAFEKIFKEGFFPIWNPEAPVKYFEDEKEGYLAVFRVYKLSGPISESLLERGRKGRNYFFKLDETTYSKTLFPIIDDLTFNKMKFVLIELLKLNNWLIDII